MAFFLRKDGDILMLFVEPVKGERDVELYLSTKNIIKVRPSYRGIVRDAEFLADL